MILPRRSSSNPFTQVLHLKPEKMQSHEFYSKIWRVSWASQLKFSPKRSSDNSTFSLLPSQQIHLREIDHSSSLLLESTLSLVQSLPHFTFFSLLKIASDITYSREPHPLLFFPPFPDPRLHQRLMPWAWEQSLVIWNKLNSVSTSTNRITWKAGARLIHSGFSKVGRHRSIANLCWINRWMNGARIKDGIYLLPLQFSPSLYVLFVWDCPDTWLLTQHTHVCVHCP